MEVHRIVLKCHLLPKYNLTTKERVIMKIQVIVTGEELKEMALSIDDLEDSILHKLDTPVDGIEFIGFDIEMMEKY